MQKKADFNEAFGRKFPEQIVIVLARDPSGKTNPMSAGWTMITSGNPAMLAVSLQLKSYTLAAIRQARAFVISFPSTRQEDEVRYFGSKSGRDTDKTAYCHTTLQPADVIDCDLLADAVANFECQLTHDLITGDHALIVGQVVAAHVNPDPDVKRLYSLAGGRMAGITQQPD